MTEWMRMNDPRQNSRRLNRNAKICELPPPPKHSRFYEPDRSEIWWVDFNRLVPTMYSVELHGWRWCVLHLDYSRDASSDRTHTSSAARCVTWQALASSLSCSVLPDDVGKHMPLVSRLVNSTAALELGSLLALPGRSEMRVNAANIITCNVDIIGGANSMQGYSTTWCNAMASLRWQ